MFIIYANYVMIDVLALFIYEIIVLINYNQIDMGFSLIISRAVIFQYFIESQSQVL